MRSASARGRAGSDDSAAPTSPGSTGDPDRQARRDLARARGDGPEGELVEVGGQVSRLDRPVMRPEQPALEQRSDAMDAGKGDVGERDAQGMEVDGRVGVADRRRLVGAGTAGDLRVEVNSERVDGVFIAGRPGGYTGSYSLVYDLTQRIDKPTFPDPFRFPGAIRGFSGAGRRPRRRRRRTQAPRRWTGVPRSAVTGS